MPWLSRMRLPAVGRAMKDAGLKWRRKTWFTNSYETHKPSYWYGRAWGSRPAAGMTVATGTVVTVYMAPDKYVRVPDLRGRTTAEAETLLTATNLVLDFNPPQVEPKLPPGIFAFSPNPQAFTGDAIRVTCNHMEMPALIGTSLDDAEGACAKLGLAVTVKSKGTWSPNKDGVVTGQAPAAGDLVETDTPVTLYMPRDPQAPPPGAVYTGASGFVLSKDDVTGLGCFPLAPCGSGEWHTLANVGREMQLEPERGPRDDSSAAIDEGARDRAELDFWFDEKHYKKDADSGKTIEIESFYSCFTVSIEIYATVDIARGVIREELDSHIAVDNKVELLTGLGEKAFWVTRGSPWGDGAMTRPSVYVQAANCMFMVVDLQQGDLAEGALKALLTAVAKRTLAKGGAPDGTAPFLGNAPSGEDTADY